MKYLALFFIMTTGALAQYYPDSGGVYMTCHDSIFVTPAGKTVRTVSRQIPWNPYWDDPGPCGKPPVTIVLEKGCPVCGETKKKAKCVPQYAHVACLKCGTVFSWERCE